MNNQDCVTLAALSSQTAHEHVKTAHDMLMREMAALSCIEHALPQDAAQDEPCSRIAVHSVYGRLGEIGELLERALQASDTPKPSPEENQLGPYIPTTIAQALDEQMRVLWTAICTMDALMVAHDYAEAGEKFDPRSVLEGIRDLTESVHGAIEPMSIAQRAAAIEAERASEVAS